MMHDLKKYRVLVATIIVAIVASIYYFDIYHYLTLDFFRDQQAVLTDFVRDNLLLSVVIFFAVYVSATAISLPVAGIFCVAAGALFGMPLGSVVISFASTAGAVAAFLISRFLLQNFVERRFPHAAQVVNQGIENDGPYYLFCIRLVPAFPYFVINMVMGLTHMPVWTFAWVTQLALLPITFVLTNAGEQIALIRSPGDLVSPALMGALALIGIFPLIARKALNYFRRQQVDKH